MLDSFCFVCDGFDVFGEFQLSIDVYAMMFDVIRPLNRLPPILMRFALVFLLEKSTVDVFSAFIVIFHNVVPCLIVSEDLRLPFCYFFP